MNRYSLGLVLMIPASIGLSVVGFRSGLNSPLFNMLIALLLFLSIQGMLQVLKVQNRFKPIVGFAKIMILCRLIAELITRYGSQTISIGKIEWFANISGALSVLSLLTIALLRARFPYPEKASTTKGSPTLRHCPSCGLKLQRSYNPNACPSCSAVFKVRWMDRLPFN